MQTPLFTDFYELTMAYGYWKNGLAERQAVFQLLFRKNPFQGHYTIACGLENIIEYLQNYHFSKDELNYLASLKTANNQRLFPKAFLRYLKKLKFTCNVDAIAEGNLVFPHEPLLRVRGPLLQCQLLETVLINIMNYSSLIATKASRIVYAAQNDEVIEFGLRRAHGPNGGLMASRAAFIGGCHATSNTLAGKIYAIPVKGTVAHSWIMVFPDELTALHAFAETMPQDCILLVDTYNTEKGVQNAIIVGKKLREQGFNLAGIRLDSGDLYKLSYLSRKLLDSENFQQTKIIASGDLNEHIIQQLKQQGAPIDIWGVGTQLTTAYDQPSLDMIYKLTAIQNEQQNWQYKLKRSDTAEKTTHPGIQQVRRYYQNNIPCGDCIYDEQLGIKNNVLNAENFTDLLTPIFAQGKLVYQSPPIQEMRKFCLTQVAQFNQNIKQNYPVIIEESLQKLKMQIMQNLI